MKQDKDEFSAWFPNIYSVDNYMDKIPELLFGILIIRWLIEFLYFCIEIFRKIKSAICTISSTHTLSLCMYTGPRSRGRVWLEASAWGCVQTLKSPTDFLIPDWLWLPDLLCLSHCYHCGHDWGFVHWVSQKDCCICWFNRQKNVTDDFFSHFVGEGRCWAQPYLCMQPLPQ